MRAAVVAAEREPLDLVGVEPEGRHLDTPGTTDRDLARRLPSPALDVVPQ